MSYDQLQQAPVLSARPMPVREAIGTIQPAAASRKSDGAGERAAVHCPRGRATIGALSSALLGQVNAVKFCATRRFGDHYETPPISAAELRASVRDGLALGLWLEGRLVAVSVALRIGTDVHLDFLGASRCCAGGGHGAALLDALYDMARTRELARITLVTSGSVPWNQPYYAARGYEDVPPEAAAKYLKDRAAAQTRLFAKSPQLLPRVMMSKTISR